MKTFAAFMLSLLLFVSPAAAQLVAGVPFKAETVTVSTTSVGFTADFCGSGSGLIQVLTNAIFIRLDGPAATNADYKLSASDWFAVKHPDRVEMLRDGSTDANVRLTCFVV